MSLVIASYLISYQNNQQNPITNSLMGHIMAKDCMEKALETGIDINNCTEDYVPLKGNESELCSMINGQYDAINNNCIGIEQQHCVMIGGKFMSDPNPFIPTNCLLDIEGLDSHVIGDSYTFEKQGIQHGFGIWLILIMVVPGIFIAYKFYKKIK